MKLATDRKGYITLEAALILPVFILAVLALGYYIRIFAVTENVSYSVIEETSRIASEAYITKSVPLFENRLEKRITDTVPEAESADVTRVRYLYHDGDNDDMISVNVSYQVNKNLPVGFGNSVDIVSKVKCRGFTGLDKTGVPMSFDEMETESTWEPVWIFPADGEKYHNETCTYVISNAKEMVLTEQLKKNFDPCSSCEADKAVTGEYVYCFTENGYVYHKEECRHVTRYVTEINKSEAIDKGYVPCTKCGGG